MHHQEYQSEEGSNNLHDKPSRTIELSSVFLPVDVGRKMSRNEPFRTPTVPQASPLYHKPDIHPPRPAPGGT